MSNLNRLFFSLLVFVAFLSAAFAQDLRLGVNNLANRISVLEDHGGHFKYEQIISPQLQTRFKSLDGLDVTKNYGFTNSVYWIKLSLSRDALDPKDWVIEIPYLGLDKVELYDEQGLVATSGGYGDLDRRSIFYRFDAFPITLSTQTKSYYLKLSAQYSLTLPIKLWPAFEFQRMTQIDGLFQGAFFGLIFALAFYTLILGIFLKDKGYLLYSVYGALLWMAVFAGNGYGRIFLWSKSPGWDAISQSVLFSLSTAFVMLFTRYFLRLSSRFPMISKIYIAMSLTYVFISLSLILSLHWTIDRGLLYQLLFGLTFPAVLLVIGTTLFVWRLGQRSSRFFLLAWLVLSIGALVSTLRVFDLLPSNPLTLYAMQISSAIEMLLFTFALADQVRNEYEQFEVVKNENIYVKQELSNALTIAESRLEQTVNVRTNELRSALDAQKRVNQQYVRFVSMISHEFRNPLNVIEIQSALIQKEGVLGMEKLDQRINVIGGAVQRIAMLFNKWMQNDRLSTAMNSLNLESIDLNVWVRMLISKAENYGWDHEVRISYFSDREIVKVDTQLLELAIINLIDNACKYSPDSTYIELEILHQNGQVGIAVVDSGIGMDASYKEKIFEEYFRINEGKQFRGIGLGLSFARKIALMHRGNIEVQTKLGIGSRFIFWLPLDTIDS